MQTYWIIGALKNGSIEDASALKNWSIEVLKMQTENADWIENSSME